MKETEATKRILLIVFANSAAAGAARNKVKGFGLVQRKEIKNYKDILKPFLNDGIFPTRGHLALSEVEGPYVLIK